MNAATRIGTRRRMPDGRARQPSFTFPARDKLSIGEAIDLQVESLVPGLRMRIDDF
jgi:hypothetical protein